MDNLYIDETKYTPKIELDSKGYIYIVGKSYPENTFEFYEPIIQWVKSYFQTDLKNALVVDIEITYFNSSSSKLFFDLFDLFEENNQDNDITINWIYDEENESAAENGEDFVEDFEDLNIKLTIK